MKSRWVFILAVLGSAVITFYNGYDYWEFLSLMGIIYILLLAMYSMEKYLDDE